MPKVVKNVISQSLHFILFRGPNASGWRESDKKSKFWDVLRHKCKNYQESHAVKCINESTYGFRDLVEDAWLEDPIEPTKDKPNLMKDDLWRPDFTLTWPGMCHTLNIKNSMGNSIIHLFLNTNLTFIVFIHDPQYFVYTYNPQTIPMTSWILPKSNQFLSLSIVKTEHEELNVPNDPCIEETTYIFSACIKRSL